MSEKKQPDDYGFKITIEYICSNMIDPYCYDKDFNGDAMEAYKMISDDFKDDIFNFCDDSGRVVKVEAIKELSKEDCDE